MRLLIEHLDSVNTVQLDEATGKKNYYIEGVFMQSNVTNRNKRVYPKAVMESALNTFQDKIQTKKALGEMNHPSSPTVNYERVSHIITELRWDGDNVIGRAKIITDLPMGAIAKSLIDEGVPIGVSSRAMGSVKLLKDGVSEVQNDLQISTVDIVSDPSAHDAFTQGLVESKEWIMENGLWREVEAAAVRTMVTKAKSGRELEEAKVKAFQMFIERCLR